VSIVREIHQRYGVASIWSHEETGNGWTFQRDRAVAAWAKEHGVPWHELATFGVIRRLRSRNGWANAWDRMMAEAITEPPVALQPIKGNWPISIPTFSELGLAPDPCPDRQTGGRAAALSNLTSFLNERGLDSIGHCNVC
jgi:deoxyribodipyrimidine photo-lyase